MSATALRSPAPPLLPVLLPAVAAATVGLALLGWLASRTGSLASGYAAWYSGYHVYLPVLLALTLAALLPDLRRRGFSLADVVVARKLPVDLLLGIAAGVVGLVVAVVWVQLTGFRFPAPPETAPVALRLAVLALLAPPVKEIVFRWYPAKHLSPKLGAFGAFLVGNLAFALWDWQNLGASFFAGAVWAGAYALRRRLVVPIVGHAVANLLAIFAG